ncbi:MAG: glycosyltransferase [Hyphomicrobium sp.]|jgi:glycosyltransferase involved in cell wall biosynthesis
MLVSVYLPTRNRADLLASAVRSVLQQTHADFELIVVNDGSSDGTADYLADAVGRDQRISVLSNERPLGAPAARNRAIYAARGAFVTGLDDDDTFFPERLASFLAYWRLLEHCGVRPSCVYAQDVLDLGGTRQSETKKRSAVVASDLFEANHIGNQVFAPREHFLGCGLFNERLPAWQDLECFYRMLSAYGPARLLDMTTYTLDLSPRQDRISRRSEANLRDAFRMVARLHARSPQSVHQLRLQLFTELYGVRPKLEDYRDALRHGAWPRGLLQLVRASLKLRGRLSAGAAADAT